MVTNEVLYIFLSKNRRFKEIIVNKMDYPIKTNLAVGLLWMLVEKTTGARRISTVPSHLDGQSMSFS